MKKKHLNILTLTLLIAGSLFAAENQSQPLLELELESLVPTQEQVPTPFRFIQPFEGKEIPDYTSRFQPAATALPDKRSSFFDSSFFDFHSAYGDKQKQEVKQPEYDFSDLNRTFDPVAELQAIQRLERTGKKNQPFRERSMEPRRLIDPAERMMQLNSGTDANSKVEIQSEILNPQAWFLPTSSTLREFNNQAYWMKQNREAGDEPVEEKSLLNLFEQYIHSIDNTSEIVSKKFQTPSFGGIDPEERSDTFPSLNRYYQSTSIENGRLNTGMTYRYQPEFFGRSERPPQSNRTNIQNYFPELYENRANSFDSADMLRNREYNLPAGGVPTGLPGSNFSTRNPAYTPSR